MNKLGDTHNGQSVSILRRGNKNYLAKPRCVFWEYLFLDPKSEFRQYLYEKTNINLESIVGNVKYYSTDDYMTGQAEYIEASKSNSLKLEDIAQISAFCMIFGIGDIHNSNMLISDEKLQIIDIECIFNDYKLLQSTLLAPAKWNKNNNSTSLKEFCTRQNKNLDRFQFIEFIEAFKSTIDIFANNIDAIKLWFSMNLQKLKNYPIRVLLKHTHEYYLVLKKESNMDNFLPEEISQMMNNDIPYFWTYIEEPNLYWLDSCRKQQVVKSSNEKIINLKKITAKSPGRILDKQRWYTILENVTAEISKNLLDECEYNKKDELLDLYKYNNEVVLVMPKMNINIKYRI
ncbi:MAG: DUF4135 domain-containing protein [Pseudobdellovibrio sp.]